ncbi:MAG: peptide deformylase [Chloroflexaceae bacterium]|nr:peptide deformylase [Chloroflexaceae bacterium]
MALRRILQMDDPEDNKILKTPCRRIKLPDRELKYVVADMLETMHHADGVGLAAPQIGLSIALTVIWLPPVCEKQEDGSEIEVAPAQDLAFINPQIVKKSQNTIMRQEGCLSLPNWYGDVPRATWVTIEYQEPNGKTRRLRKIDGLLGWVIQHEIDHLNGILFTERMPDPSTLHYISDEEMAEASAVAQV